ncbi:transcription factor bHLH96-like [Arachis hypogaea]|uniref:transcription factor bHLH96-like n=1 Tax=Arachis hypogaea TaxID=3818 RepID=UPI0007AF4185
MPFSEFFGFSQVTGNADIEVAMVESHANLKIRSNKKPKQLLKMVSNLQAMRLTILHLNVTTTNNDIVLYSLSVKVEDDCKLGSVDEIATAVCQMIENIQHESVE